MEAIDGFIGKLDELAKAGTEVENLQNQTIEAEVEALEKIVQKLHPVMRFIDYKIKIHGHRPGHQFGEWEYDHYPEKGLIPVDYAEKHATDRDYRGIYRGHFLVLTRSGKFLKFDQDGEWSKWQNEGSYFQNEPTEITTKKAVEIYGFSSIIKGMRIDFEESVKKAESKKQQLGSRMEQLTQIEAILK